MKALILVFAFICVGCTTQVVVHDTAYFDSLKATPPLAVSVEELSSPQAIVVKADDGKEYAAFTKTEFDKLRQFKANAKTNAEKLQAVTDATNAIIAERNAILAASKAMERRANMLERDYARTEEKLRVQEQNDLIEDTIYKIIILGLVLGI